MLKESVSEKKSEKEKKVRKETMVLIDSLNFVWVACFLAFHFGFGCEFPFC